MEITHRTRMKAPTTDTAHINSILCFNLLSPAIMAHHPSITARQGRLPRAVHGPRAVPDPQDAHAGALVAPEHEGAVQ